MTMLAAAESTMAKTKRRGEKFTEKYDGVATFQAYAVDPDKVYIPEKGHPLYDLDGNSSFDESRVVAIDAAGSFDGTILVWSDPDERRLYVVDGRGNVLDLREVNRRRRDRGDDGIPIKFVRFTGTLDEAVEHVARRNFARKRPTLGHTGREVQKFWRLGRPWLRIADILHLDAEQSTERWLRRTMMLAYCVPEVVSAVESGEISLSKVRRFAGTKVDGSERLSRADQLAALAEIRAAREAKKDKPTGLSRKDRAAVAQAVREKAGQLKRVDDRRAAEVALAVLARLDGDSKALAAWPDLASLVNAALVEQVLGHEEEE